MFKNPSNYFLAISFEWKDIFRILEVPEDQQSDFEVDEKYRFQSPNANSTDGLGINSSSALFEYYILPNSLRNGAYSYSSIYDQQLKRFFESPNINYGPVLRNPKKKDSSLICFFNKNLVNNKAGFSVLFFNEGKSKAVIFLFNESYLNLKDAHVKWGDKIPFESFKIPYRQGDDIVKKISISSDVLWISTSIQSQDDSPQSSPFYHDLHGFFKK